MSIGVLRKSSFWAVRGLRGIYTVERHKLVVLFLWDQISENNQNVAPGHCGTIMGRCDEKICSTRRRADYVSGNTAGVMELRLRFYFPLTIHEHQSFNTFKVFSVQCCQWNLTNNRRCGNHKVCHVDQTIFAF